MSVHREGPDGAFLRTQAIVLISWQSLMDAVSAASEHLRPGECSQWDCERFERVLAAMRESAGVTGKEKPHG